MSTILFRRSGIVRTYVIDVDQIRDYVNSYCKNSTCKESNIRI